MKSLTVATAVEKSKLASSVPFLILVDVAVKDTQYGSVVETMRLVRNSEDITYQGNLYLAFPFDIDVKVEAGSSPNVTLSADDHSRIIQARLQAYPGIIGSDLTMMIVNHGNLNAAPELVEYFQITGASASGYRVTFNLGTENALAMPFPRRRQMRDRCAWRYKSTECGYTGELTTCDQTLQGPNGCSFHQNEINFGGFPGIKSNGFR